MWRLWHQSYLSLTIEDRGGQVLPLASDQVSHHVEDLEQFGKEHLKAVTLTFRLGALKSHR